MATIGAVVGANVDVVLCLEFSVLQSTFKKDENGKRIFMLGYIIQNLHIKDMIISIYLADLCGCNYYCTYY